MDERAGARSNMDAYRFRHVDPRMWLAAGKHHDKRLADRGALAGLQHTAVQNSVDGGPDGVPVQVDSGAVASCQRLLDGLFGLREFFDGRAGEPFLENCQRHPVAGLCRVQCGLGAVQEFRRRESFFMDFANSRQFVATKPEFLRRPVDTGPGCLDLLTARTAHEFVYSRLLLRQRGFGLRESRRRTRRIQLHERPGPL